MNRFLLICISLVLLFLYGTLTRLGGNAGKLLVEGTLCCSIIFFSSSVRYFFPTGCLLLAVAWVLFSALFNGVFCITAFLLYRHLLLTAFFSALVFSTPLTTRQCDIIIRIIIVFVLIQIVYSGFKILLGSREEAIVGTIISTGGAVATTMTLVAVGLFLGLYWFFKTKYLLLIPLSMLIGFASGKRAIFYLVPLYILILSIGICVFSAYHHRWQRQKSFRKIFLILFLCIMVFPIFITAVQLSNFERETYFVDRDQAVAYLIDVARDYISGDEYDTEYGSGSRVINIEQAFDKATIDINSFFFGYGADSFRVIDNNEKMYNLGIFYGLSGFCDDMLSNGFPFALLLMMFYAGLMRILLGIRFSRLSPFWQGIYCGTWGYFLAYILIHYLYSSDFSQLPLLPSLGILLCAVLSRQSDASLPNAQLEEKKC